MGGIKECCPTEVPFKLISERYIRATKTRGKRAPEDGTSLSLHGPVPGGSVTRVKE